MRRLKGRPRVLGQSRRLRWSTRTFAPSRIGLAIETMVRTSPLVVDRIVRGDCLGALRDLPDGSIDLVCTDPPYGIGFAGKWWDAAVPPVAVWEEVWRVLKPGAFAFVMSAARQDVLGEMIANLAAAGFDIALSSLYWTYTKGFPKAGDAMLAAMRRLGDPGVAVGRRVLDAGIGDRLKSERGRALVEHDILMATDPRALALRGAKLGFQPKPAVEVVLVAMKPPAAATLVGQALTNGKAVTWMLDPAIPGTGDEATMRRFPANLLVSDGILGAHSRYFALDAWAEALPAEVRARLPFLVVPKPGNSERGRDGAGLAENTHPTVKPLQLMLYLVTLGSRPGDLVLDPFAGSGTTLVAARALGRRYLGIEIDRTYAAIAEARLDELEQTVEMQP